MILTDAPNDFGGRLRRNCARTTPEFPVPSRQRVAWIQEAAVKRTYHVVS